jgi:hypothetical protein
MSGLSAPESEKVWHHSSHQLRDQPTSSHLSPRAQLLETLQRHARFQVGAQFAVSRRALTDMPPPFRGMLAGAKRDMLTPKRRPKMCRNLGFPTDTFLPWILERLWQSIFHLAELHRRHASAGAGPSLSALVENHLDEWVTLTGGADLMGPELRSRAWQEAWLGTELHAVRGATADALGALKACDGKNGDGGGGGACGADGTRKLSRLFSEARARCMLRLQRDPLSMFE